MAFTGEPTMYVAPTDMHYASGDVYAFHVEPGSGDIVVHFNATGIPATARIFFDDWESMARTVKEEHDAREKRRNDGNDEHRNHIYGRGNNADNDE